MGSKVGQTYDCRVSQNCYRFRQLFRPPEGNRPKTEKCYSFLLSTKHYIKTAANESRGDKKFSKYAITRELCEKLSLRLRTINPCQRPTYGKAYQKFPKHETMMSQIVLFATVLPKLDSLSAMRIQQVRRTKTIFP
ncbi:hypothetical protein AVEN_243920-1 [Araneus ventricosus]|uniref:Uncharacterized protein n=1 Tax=Araneus ventricosus TaxID=182803 RepID=A0A4Y2UST5_ARAVE|nr:hypothetical protein AVEN_243920-1 [Araneus ventricosus]